MKNIRGRHKPIRFDRYREIHDTVIEQYKSKDFIAESTLGFQPYPGSFLLSGEIGCLGSILITVEKLLVVLSGFGESAIVQTEEYSYNASIRGYRNIIRYDNDHSHLNHLDRHHKHVFDWKNEQDEDGTVYWVGENEWPTLGDVIGELEEWYWANRDDLPYPDSYPVLGLRCGRNLHLNYEGRL